MAGGFICAGCAYPPIIGLAINQADPQKSIRRGLGNPGIVIVSIG